MKVLNFNWYAWFNMMTDPDTFHVTGQVDVGDTTTGATILFQSIENPKSLEKSDPAVLVLRIVLQANITSRSDGNTAVRLHFMEEDSPSDYGAVRVLLDGAVLASIDRVDEAY